MKTVFPTLLIFSFISGEHVFSIFVNVSITRIIKPIVSWFMKEKSVIMEIDVVGAKLAKKTFPDCVLVMVVPPSMDELKRRLQGRGSETEEQIAGRLQRMEYELSHQDEYDYIIVNDDLETAIKTLENIIDERRK